MQFSTTVSDKNQIFHVLKQNLEFGGKRHVLNPIQHKKNQFLQITTHARLLSQF